MSDFDKEAEREKLRKKFAADEEKRANTRRMSELLLKGATMTNKHCDRCGDPLFRYDGQTFCPTCQADGAEVQPQPDAEGSADGKNMARESTDGENMAGQPADPQNPDTQESAEAGRQPQAGQSARSQADQSSQPVSPVGGQGNKTGSTEVDDRPRAQSGDLTEARQSLRRTVTRFARAAEGTDDPRRARELLAAAREAAATLSELE
ncbi:MAG: Sjogren's syndrome/scleroderma autoantigen 1 family protein [Halohasta sp.]